MHDLLKSSKKVFLLEPPYQRKYVPLALAKISAYVKANGGTTTFGREFTPGDYDLVAVTSIFTYDSKEVIEAIRQVQFLDPQIPIIVGGVYATMNPRHLERETGIAPYTGWSKELDLTVPDYDIDWGTEGKWSDFNYIFTTRGCPNNCAYCIVPRIEPEYWVNPRWRDIMRLVRKPNIMLQDNNFAAAPLEHVRSVMRYLVGSGKGVYFDGGFDCKYVTDELARYTAKLKIVDFGVRIAFDRIEDEHVFQDAARTLIKYGVKKESMLAYVLFNFTDTPQEAHYRATEVMRLGIRPYPQRYTPLTYLSREKKFLGKHWTENLAQVWRYFWLMQGHHKKKTFEEWAVTIDETHPLNPLSSEDWEAWRAV